MNKDYEILQRIFDPTPIKEEANRLEDNTADDTYILENNGSLRSIFAPHWRSEIINDFIYNNPAIPYIKEQLGDDIYIHQCHFNYKKSHTGGEFAWHSDYTYWHNMDGMPNPHAISVLYILDDMHNNNGPLQILPESHTLPVEKFETDSWTIKHSADENLGIMASKTAYKALQLVANAGDCVVMHANTLHASDANLSNDDRTVLFVCYNRLDNKVTKNLRPNYITLRDFIKV